MMISLVDILVAVLGFILGFYFLAPGIRYYLNLDGDNKNE